MFDTELKISAIKYAEFITVQVEDRDNLVFLDLSILDDAASRPLGAPTPDPPGSGVSMHARMVEMAKPLDRQRHNAPGWGVERPPIVLEEGSSEYLPVQG